LGVVEKLILDVRLWETRLLLLLPQREDDDFNIEPLLLLLKELLVEREGTVMESLKLLMLVRVVVQVLSSGKEHDTLCFLRSTSPPFGAFENSVKCSGKSI